MSTVRVSLDSMSLPLFISDSLGLLIEPEKLILSVLNPSVEVDPSGSVASHDSLHWHVRSEVEWSVDVETEFFIESLSLILGSFVKIDDIPFLADTISVLSDNNLSGFLVSGSIDSKDSLVSVDIDELAGLELEDLVPL